MHAEVSYTGLHGANRMASNSLLECLVYGWSAAEDITRRMPDAHGVSTLPPWMKAAVENPDERVVIQHNWHELRAVYVGLRWHCAHNEAPGTRPAADNHAPTRNRRILRPFPRLK